jgi:hypothetical protein
MGRCMLIISTQTAPCCCHLSAWESLTLQCYLQPASCIWLPRHGDYTRAALMLRTDFFVARIIVCAKNVRGEQLDAI